jgi:hypothetical protein
MTGNSTIKSSPAPKVKLYVIDPRKYQERAAAAAAAAARKNVTQPPPNSEWKEMNPPLSVRVKKKVVRKVREVQGEDDEEEDEALRHFLTQETTTRVGRVSKPWGSGSGAVEEPSAEPSPPAPKIKRRQPPDVFKCLTCNKHYLGYTKLRLHFRKFPTHQGSSEYERTMVPPVRRLSASVGIQVESPSPSPRPRLSVEGGRSPGTDSPLTLSDLPENQSEGNRLVYTEVPHPSLEPLVVPDLCLPLSSLGIGREEAERSSAGPTPNAGDEFLHLNPRPSSSALPFWNVFNFNSSPSDSDPTPPPQVCPVRVPTPSSARTTALLSPSPRERPGGVVSQSQLKSVWDLVEEKLVQQGVNQVGIKTNISR